MPHLWEKMAPNFTILTGYPNDQYDYLSENALKKVGIFNWDLITEECASIYQTIRKTL